MSVAAAMSAPEYDDIRGGTIEQFTVDQNVSYGVARKNQVYKDAPPVSNRPKIWPFGEDYDRTYGGAVFPSCRICCSGSSHFC